MMDAARRKERDRKEAKEKLSLIMQQTQEDNERLAKNAYLTTARKTLYLAASPFAGQIGGLACIVMFYVELYVSLKNPHDALFTKNKKTLKSTRKAQFGKTVRNGDDKVPWKYYAFAMAPFVSLFSVFAACLGSWELTVDKKYAYLHKKRVPFLLLGAGGLAIEGWRFYAERQENDALILDAECVRMILTE